MYTVNDSLSLARMQTKLLHLQKNKEANQLTSFFFTVKFQILAHRLFRFSIISFTLSTACGANSITLSIICVCLSKCNTFTPPPFITRKATGLMETPPPLPPPNGWRPELSILPNSLPPATESKTYFRHGKNYTSVRRFNRVTNNCIYICHLL